jgi:hypothetical protein
MSHFFINNHAADDGNHEVHRVGCKRMPTDKAYLGNFEHVDEALMEARKEFWQSGSCGHCAAGVRVEPRPVRIGGVLIWSPEAADQIRT